MVMGTTSDAGKSAVVTALCRILHRRGIAVAPFKPQNMALNSAVTIDGGEIGRAQAVQARACGLEPHSDFNPVLLKPNSDTGSQVIVNGHPLHDRIDARSYHALKPQLLQAVVAAHARLAARYQVVITEGAGSPAEINLRDGDIANMGFAEAIDCPVLLVADIERGGVFASLSGTLDLLSDSERGRIIGLVINRFRGDPGILQPGIDWIEQHTGKPVLGVIPYLHQLYLEGEDSLARTVDRQGPTADQASIDIVVPALPRFSNQTDLDPLRLHPAVRLSVVPAGATPPPVDLVILPGSKSVRDDLAWLRAQGWEPYLERHLRYGGRLLGICGGFQMLGRVLHDPDGLEGPSGSSDGLGLLDMETTLARDKQLRRRRGTLAFDDAAVEGYEIHQGLSQGSALNSPLVRFEQGHDGAISADGQIAGTYLHGLFDHGQARAALLAWAGLHDAAPAPDYRELIEQGIDRVADCVAQSLDIDHLLPAT